MNSVAVDLAFDVGNTETAVAVFHGEQIHASWRIATDSRRTPDEYGALLSQLLTLSQVPPTAVRSATIASVVPAMTPLLSHTCRAYLGVLLAEVTARTPLPIRLAVDEPLTVGPDRIVNTLAASRLYQSDTIVVDLGTATTYDCITAAGEFIGGVIAPGVRTSAERLTERAAMLPRVEMRRPEAVIGRRTETCLHSGIFFGAVDAVDGMVSRIRREWGRPQTLVVATGGLAQMIGPHCAQVDRVEPTLTLRGVWMAGRLMDAAADHI